jgi:Na+/melibiose symporter-like transporter
VRALVRLLAAHRDYRLLLTAGLVSMTGDWVLHVGLTYLVYSITGSTLASGAMLLAAFLPSILLGSVAGVLVDRWDRRKTMIAANLLQVIGLIPLLAVHDSGTIWVVYLVAAYQGTVEQFFGPAEQALIPHLVPEKDLLAANGVNSQVRNLARLVGSGAGGVTAGLAGITGLALVDAASFALAAGLLTLIRFRPAAAAERADAPTDGPGDGAPDGHEPAGQVVSVGAIARIVGEWRSGLRTCAESPALRVVLIFMAITAMGEGIMGTLFAPFVRDVLHGSGSSYGLIVGVQAVGGLVGGLSVASAGHRWSAYTLFGWGAVAFGCVDLMLFLYPLVLSGIAPAVVFMVLVGVPGACTVAGLMTTFQTMTSDEFRGRVYGAMTAVQGLSVLIGIGVASWLGEAVGIVPIIAIQGGGYIVGGVMVLLVLRGTAAGRVHVDQEPAVEAAPSVPEVPAAQAG